VEKFKGAIVKIKRELAVSVISIMFIIFFAFPVGCSSYPTEPQLKDQPQHNFIRVCETDALGRPEECSYMHRTVVEQDLQEIFGRR
tara:strand:- start:1386 stop:1643 length:258 start_codon:yes stop_codon:yes gene_type:complete